MRLTKGYFSSQETSEMWKYFFQYKNNIQNLSIWSGNENGRFNKKFYFLDNYALNQFYENSPHNIKFFLSKFLHFDSTYNSPWGPEEVGFLERIQVIESKVSFSENLKGNHLYRFHIDRVNTYKQLMLCSEISIKDGPFQVANLDSCKDDAKKILKKLEYQHSKGKNWRDFDSTLDCSDFVSIVGNPGDLLTIDGREPHRASKVYPGHKRRVIIFEYMTKLNSRRYRETLNY